MLSIVENKYFSIVQYTFQLKGGFSKPSIDNKLEIPRGLTNIMSPENIGFLFAKISIEKIKKNIGD